MAKVSGGIPPLPEKCVYFMTHSQNGFEEFDSHSETPPNIIFFVNNGIINKVAPHQLVVPFYPPPP
jgi:hypothetical protein